jgi:hypothetical protein
MFGAESIGRNDAEHFAVLAGYTLIISPLLKVFAVAVQRIALELRRADEGFIP